MPSIYGRPAEVIKDAMLAFRSDARPATVMNRIAKGYSEAEIERIAAYLATRIDDVAD